MAERKHRGERRLAITAAHAEHRGAHDALAALVGGVDGAE